VQDLDLTVADGGFVVLLGPTGARQTTTLRLIAGLEQPDREHHLDRRPGRHGAAAGGARRRLRVPAILALSAPPVFDNLAFPLRSPARRAVRRRHPQARADDGRMLHIAPKLQNKATRLSGGEMQRVAIGRALVPALGLSHGRAPRRSTPSCARNCGWS
jgi:multiple sugar transport system ATP-binding protein